MAVAKNLIKLVEAGIGDRLTRHLLDVGRSRLAQVLNPDDVLPLVKLTKAAQKRLGDTPSVQMLLSEVGPDDVSKLLKKHKIPLTLSPEEYDEDLLYLGFRPIPGYDYNKGASQLKGLLRQNREPVESAYRNNILAAYNLWENPSSPTFRRVVGDETDPKKVLDIVVRERRKASSFYPDYNESMRRQLDNPSAGTLERAIGGRAPLSTQSSPNAETLSGVWMSERPDLMMQDELIPREGYKDIWGNMSTTTKNDAILKALRSLASLDTPITNPRLLSADGKVIKLGSYMRNNLDPEGWWEIPGRSGLVQPATVDSHAMYAGLGGMRPLGGSGNVIIDDQDLYNWASQQYEGVARELGITPSSFQAGAWAPMRELLNNDLELLATGRQLNLSPEMEAAIRGTNPNPQGLFDAAKSSVLSNYKAMMGRGDPKAAARLARSQQALESIRQMNPNLRALMLLAGAGGVGSVAGQTDPMQSLARRRAATTLYGGTS